MPTDSFTDALERLDPASRALLDLSLRRGMLTEDIADVLGADADSVAASRDDALRRVAEDVGMPGDDRVDEVRTRLAELPPDEWLGRPLTNGTSTTHMAEPESERSGDRRVGATPVKPRPGPVAILPPVAEEPAAEPPAAEPPEEDLAEEKRTKPRRWSRVWAVLPGLVVVAGAIVAIVLASSAGNTAKSPGRPSAGAPATPPAAKPQPAPTNAQASFAPVGGTAGVAGTARIVGDRLVVGVRGLPRPRRGYHEVWLYNTLLDAYSLGRSDSGHIKLDAKLPPDWKRYRFVDISREPNDGNPSHSGQSVARVPVRSLAR